MLLNAFILVLSLFFSACSDTSDCCTIDTIDTNTVKTIDTNTTTIITPQPVYQPIKPFKPVLEVIEPEYTVKAYSSSTGKHLNNKLSCDNSGFIVECNKPCSIKIKAFFLDEDNDKYLIDNAIKEINLSTYVSNFELLKSCNCVNFLVVTTNFEDNITTKFNIKLD